MSSNSKPHFRNPFGFSLPAKGFQSTKLVDVDGNLDNQEFTTRPLEGIDHFEYDEGQDYVVPNYRNTPPVYSGQSRMLDYAIKPLTGMTDCCLSIISTVANAFHDLSFSDKGSCKVAMIPLPC